MLLLEREIERKSLKKQKNGRKEREKFRGKIVESERKLKGEKEKREGARDFTGRGNENWARKFR